jgi:glucose-6-phosphate-specific signal transduction histidine kinase
MAIAEQFNSPTAEYWYHVEDIAYIGMMSWRNEIYDRAKIAKEYPTHPGILGFKVLPEMIHGATLQTRKNYFIIENFPTNAFVKNLKWMIENRLYKEINVPMVLGEHCVGALIVRMSKKQEITTQKIELAQALVHQATLVVQLTRLTEEAKQAAILEERNRMAGEIHDTLAQAFTGIVMQLQAAERFLVTNATQAKTCLNRAQVLAKTGLTEARRSVWALYTDIDEDLFQRLAETFHALAADTDFEIQTILEGTPYSLAAEHSLNLQRIAQESITNALRHAQARRIVLTLTYDPAFIQAIVDLLLHIQARSGTAALTMIEEDTFRSPRNGNFEICIIHTGNCNIGDGNDRAFESPNPARHVVKQIRC